MGNEECVMIVDNNVSPLGGPAPDRFQSGSWSRTLLERVEKLTRRMREPGSKLLDIGCGDGEFLQLMNEPNSFGIDLDSARLSLATDKRLSVVLADGCQLPYRDKCFQMVVSMEVLEHVPVMASLMEDVNRVLMPGGYWIVSVPSVTLKAMKLMQEKGLPVYCDEHEHYREFTGGDIPWFQHKFMRLSDIRAMFVQHGFQACHHEGLYFQLPDAWLPGNALKKVMETNLAHRVCSYLPVIRRYPNWTVLILRKAG